MSLVDISEHESRTETYVKEGHPADRMELMTG